MVSVTVKVATPLELVVAVGDPIIELPAPAANVTVWLGTGYGAVLSKIVTVIVEVVTPLALTLVGLATTVEFAVEGGPVTVNEYA